MARYFLTRSSRWASRLRRGRRSGAGDRRGGTLPSGGGSGLGRPGAGGSRRGGRGWGGRRRSRPPLRVVEKLWPGGGGCRGRWWVRRRSLLRGWRGGAGDRVEFLRERLDFGGDGAGGLALQSGQLFADGVHLGAGGGYSDSFGLDLLGQVELLGQVGVGGFDSGVLLDYEGLGDCAAGGGQADCVVAGGAQTPAAPPKGLGGRPLAGA